jgi:Domain of unknown function (DUF4157)
MDEEHRGRRLKLQRCVSGHDRPLSVTPVVHDELRSPGAPLDQGVRDQIEVSFGHDFGRVRVHADTRAAVTAHALDAGAPLELDETSTDEQEASRVAAAVVGGRASPC